MTLELPFNLIRSSSHYKLFSLQSLTKNAWLSFKCLSCDLTQTTHLKWGAMSIQKAGDQQVLADQVVQRIGRRIDRDLLNGR